MQQVEIEIVHLTFLQLLLEDVGGVVGIGQHMAGELGGQIEAVAGVLFQTGAHHGFGQVLHVGPGGVIVVYAVGHGIVHHGLRQLAVDAAVRLHGQTHSAEA